MLIEELSQLEFLAAANRMDADPDLLIYLMQRERHLVGRGEFVGYYRQRGTITQIGPGDEATIRGAAGNLPQHAVFVYKLNRAEDLLPRN